MKKTIICPVDGSNASYYVLEFAIEMAKVYGDELKILNVQPNLKELGLAVINEVSEIAKKHEVEFQTKIRVGIPSIEIVSEAKEENTRCLVMGIGKGKEEELGSVSRRTLEMAPCPVYMIPE